ncbi:MAG TPA: hypothetical protein VFO65_14390, partial [Acidimicrobiales bacterium]|nr:hypothetical protein [Acidimicrobiales bacterium]
MFDSLAGESFTNMARTVGRLADAAINWLWGQISVASAVTLGGPGFDRQLGIVAAIAGVVAVGLFAVQLTASALRRDAGGLARALKGLVVAFIGAALAIGVTNALLSATDSLASGVVRTATGGSIEEMGRALFVADAFSRSTGNPAGVILLSVASLAATTMVWAALMVRKVLIVVSAVFAPLAFAGSLADITTAWTRRWIEVTLALIVSKLVLVIIFVVGLGMLVGDVGRADAGGTQTVTQIASGVLVLALAGLAPWFALKLVHWSGGEFHHLHSLASTSTGGVQRAVDWSRSAASKASMTAGGAGAYGGGFRWIGSGSPGRGGGGPVGGAAGRPMSGVTGDQPPPAAP